MKIFGEYNSLKKLKISLSRNVFFAYPSPSTFPNGPTFCTSSKGGNKRGIGTVGEAFTVLLGRGGEETRVGGGAFASRNPVVIPGWRGRALTRCRLNLLEISRQIPGLYPRLPCRLRASLRKIGTTSVSIAVFQNPGNAVPTN